MASGVRGTQGYAEAADDLFRRYESFSFEIVHDAVMAFYPPAPATVLDVGAGTGRDADWFARAGHEVTAVEPCDALRDRARALHSLNAIRWIDDSLPELTALAGCEGAFDLIQLSAVFMHLDAVERRIAVTRLAELLKPGGRLVLLVRDGPVPAGRCMFEVPVEETLAIAAKAGLMRLHHVRRDSAGETNRRAGVSWMNYVFEKSFPAGGAVEGSGA